MSVTESTAVRYAANFIADGVNRPPGTPKPSGLNVCLIKKIVDGIENLKEVLYFLGAIACTFSIGHLLITLVLASAIEVALRLIRVTRILGASAEAR